MASHTLSYEKIVIKELLHYSKPTKIEILIERYNKETADSFHVRTWIAQAGH